MNFDFEMRVLGERDAEVLINLRMQALEDTPMAFGASPETDFMAQRERVIDYLNDRENRLLFGAFDSAGTLVAMAGIGRGHHAKSRHRADVWGMFVSPSARRCGLGAGLLEKLVDQAKLWNLDWLDLCVSSVVPGAQALYVKAGFVAWGTQPDGLRDGGRSIDTVSMSLRL